VTAYAGSFPATNVDGRGFLKLLIVLAIFAAGVTVALTAHSTNKHGADATAINRCLNNNGPNAVWQSNSWRQPNKFFQTCQLPDGRTGIRVVQRVKSGWKEVTSFVPKEGTAQNILEYLSARATKIFSAGG
jgi:hypothetical protein